MNPNNVYVLSPRIFGGAQRVGTASVTLMIVPHLAPARERARESTRGSLPSGDQGGAVTRTANDRIPDVVDVLFSYRQEDAVARANYTAARAVLFDRLLPAIGTRDITPADPRE
jgi:hypothetical protein